MNIVISQPMLFPWVGLFEQLRLSDVFVHYDDVQMPGKGNFVNRVQIKTPNGIKWLTVPVRHVSGVSLKIQDVRIREDLSWRKEHQAQLHNCYRTAPCYSELVSLLDDLYGYETDLMCEFCIHGIETIAEYFGLSRQASKQVFRSSNLGIPLQSTERVVAIVKHFSGDNYISGLGAMNYIDYEQFESEQIQLRYMDYKKVPYPQLHGEFTPYVSILDLIANCGRDGVRYICSDAVYWKDFIQTKP